jgi:L-asparaginase II
MVAAGLELPERLLALAAASHSGDLMHREGALEILAGVGLGADALQCPADVPYGARERLEWTRTGHDKERIAHNCSGKHAAMIATAAINGWPTATYREPDHPLQQRIALLVEELSGEPIAGVTIDGCGAPLFAISTRGLARAISRLVTSEEHGRVAAAMRAHPEMVAGTDRSTTHFMRAVPGLIVKECAEGVQIAALADGRTLAVKVEDGSMRALPLLTRWALEQWGYVSPRIDEIAAAPVLGGGVPVGVIEACL